MEGSNDLRKKGKIGLKNHILWILLVFLFWYVLITPLVGYLVFDAGLGMFEKLAQPFGGLSDGMKFVITFYLATLFSFVGAYVYTRVTKRNLFIYRSFTPSAPNNRVSMLLWGLVVGFVMNFGCILLALIAGDIKLFLSFSAAQIPFYLFALVCVFIQSSSEELWCRGFLYERINVRFPLWVAILVNGLIFALLHVLNPGATFLSITGIFVCGISFSLAKWYTGSIWFPAGIHTAWNFTQNFLFGLPNSGIVSEASVFSLDAATARSSLIYDTGFGVEGGIPGVLADVILGIICLVLAARQGRLGELREVRVTPRHDPEGAQPLLVQQPAAEGEDRSGESL